MSGASLARAHEEFSGTRQRLQGGLKRKAILPFVRLSPHCGKLSSKRRCLTCTHAVNIDDRPQVASKLPSLQKLKKTFRGSLDAESLVKEPELQSILSVGSEEELKDLLNCLLLSECAYKIVDMSQRAATKMVQRVKQTFPKGMITIERVQWSLPDVHHRYVLAEDKDTLYVAFMGTKQRRDLAANAAVLQEPIWPEMDDRLVIPAAHRGFWSRAKVIPIEGLYAHACLLGKRLVLTGHSLGASVAQLSLISLLRKLSKDAEPSIRSVTFACPAVGNAALKEYVTDKGWTHHFQNYLIPEDLVPRLLASPEQSAEQVADATIDALQPEETRSIQEERIGSTLRMFEEIYDVVLNDDPYQVPLNYAMGSSAISGCPGNQSPSSTSRTTSQNAKFSIHKDPSNLLPFKRPFSKTKSSPDQSLSMQSQQEKGTLPQQSSMSKPSAKAGNLQRSIYKKPLSLKSDKQKAIEAANLFREIERFSEIEKNGQEASISEPDNEIDSAASTLPIENGRSDSLNEGNALLAEPEGAVLAAITDQNASVLENDQILGAVTSDPQGRQTLSMDQDVFFPWSSKPLPSFARKAAKKVIQSAGRLKGRSIPFLSSKESKNPRQSSSNRKDTSRSFARPQDLPQISTELKQSELLANLGDQQEEDLVLPSDSVAGQIPAGEAVEDDFSQADRNELNRDSVSKRWTQKIPIQKLGANMGKAASGAARNAAKFVSVPLRAAQRRYAVLGRQAFLSPTGIIPAIGVDSDRSFQDGLEGAKRSTIASALALPSEEHASANTIVSLQLPIAAARRRQPFLMHKMAFHRARVLSMLECTLTNMGIEPYQDISIEQVETQLSEALAPRLQPTKAEVFLPYSLPDDSDLKIMLDDLGSLSSMPPMTTAIQQLTESKRFKWLKPWRWISGLGWQQSKIRGTVELTVQVRGAGLENCSKVQVKEIATGAICQTQILYRPACMSPQEAYDTLGLHRPAFLRRAARLKLQAQDTLNKVTTFIDRTNAMRLSNCLLVKLFLPLEAMTKLEARLVQQSDDDSGLMLTLQSDFRKVDIPLNVHGGGSWVISDLRSSGQFLDDWLNHNVSG